MIIIYLPLAARAGPVRVPDGGAHPGRGGNTLLVCMYVCMYVRTYVRTARTVYIYIYIYICYIHILNKYTITRILQTIHCIMLSIVYMYCVSLIWFSLVYLCSCLWGGARTHSGSCVNILYYNIHS